MPDSGHESGLFGPHYMLSSLLDPPEHTLNIIIRCLQFLSSPSLQSHQILGSTPFGKISFSFLIFCFLSPLLGGQLYQFLMLSLIFSFILFGWEIVDMFFPPPPPPLPFSFYPRVKKPERTMAKRTDISKRWKKKK